MTYFHSLTRAISRSGKTTALSFWNDFRINSNCFSELSGSCWTYLSKEYCIKQVINVKIRIVNLVALYVLSITAWLVTCNRECNFNFFLISNHDLYLDLRSLFSVISNLACTLRWDWRNVSCEKWPSLHFAKHERRWMFPVPVLEACREVPLYSKVA